MGFARSRKAATSGRGSRRKSRSDMSAGATTTNRAPLAGMFEPKSHNIAATANTATSRDKKLPRRQVFARGTVNRRGR